MWDVRRLEGLLPAIVMAVLLLPAPSASGASLAVGEESSKVLYLQQRLAGLGLYRGPFDGEFGPKTAQAVIAFHKHLGLERTFEWKDEDWRYLAVFEAPEALGEDRLVVDLDRQLLYVHLAGEVTIIPISSGNGELFRGRGGRLVRARTPEGEFTLYRHIDGMRRSYLGELWRPWYFRGGYAIHGSGSVPAHPASHGCVRVPNWDADWLAKRLRLGMPVTVGRWPVESPPEPPPLPESALRHTPAGPVDTAGRLVS